MKNGQSLIELLIAIGLASILLPALLTGLISSREGKAQSEQRLQATAILRETNEAIRSIRERSFANITTNGTYHARLNLAGTEWELGSGNQTVNGYTKQIVISDARRDGNGNIVDSGGTVDNSTKKVDTSVSWTTPRPSSVSVTSYYQRYLNNAAFLHTTQVEFAAGTHTNTNATAAPNSVVLNQSASAGTDYGNKFRNASVSSIGTMTTSGHKSSLRFTAQSTKTVSAIRVYVESENGNSPAYRYGIQTNTPTVNIPTGTWVGNFGTLTTTSAGWKTIPLGAPATLTAGTVYHIVVEPSGTPTGSANIELRRSTPNNLFYPLNGNTDSRLNTLFKAGAAAGWITQNFQPIYELDFTDSTFEGNPYEWGTEVNIFGSNWLGESFSFTGANKVVQSVSFCIRKQNNPPNNLQVVLRTGANTTLYTGTLSTAAAAPVTFSCPGSWQTHTFTPGPITLNSGTVYRIILQTSGGNANNSYRVIRNDTTNAANYNSLTYDGTTSVYTASSNAGTNWTDSGNMDMASFYFTVQGSTAYSSSGEFTSHTAGSFDTGVTNAAFNNLTWSSTVPANTTLGFQIAISNTNPPTSFVGPDGTSGTQFTSSPATITPFNALNGRYIRYKAIFTSNGTATPTLDDVSINYSP